MPSPLRLVTRFTSRTSKRKNPQSRNSSTKSSKLRRCSESKSSPLSVSSSSAKEEETRVPQKRGDDGGVCIATEYKGNIRKLGELEHEAFALFKEKELWRRTPEFDNSKKFKNLQSWKRSAGARAMSVRTSQRMRVIFTVIEPRSKTDKRVVHVTRICTSSDQKKNAKAA